MLRLMEHTEADTGAAINTVDANKAHRAWLELLDRVVTTDETVEITSEHGTVVLLSLEHYERLRTLQDESAMLEDGAVWEAAARAGEVDGSRPRRRLE